MFENPYRYWIERSHSVANSWIFWNFEFVDFFESGLELLPVMIALGEHQHVLAPLFRQPGRQGEKVGPNSIEGGVEIFFW